MTRIRVAILALMAAVIALGLVMACGGEEAAEPGTAAESETVERVVEVTRLVEAEADAGPAEYTFFSVYHTFPHPFWLMMQRAAAVAGDQTNTDVDFWIGTEYSVEDQINRVEILTAKNPDGMAVSIPDAKAADPVYRAAIDAGIPLVAVNARDPRDKGERIPYLFYVGSNEIIAGNRTGEEILERFGEPTRVAFASAQIANIAITERALGVQQVLEPLGITVDLVDVSDDPTLGTETVKGWMSANPETDYWVCGSALCQAVVTEALKELGLLNNGVTVTGFDLGEIVTPLIKDGSVKFTIDQQPYLQGYLPIVWLYLYNKAGFLPAGDVLTGPAVVDSSNIDLVAELADQYR
jgi:simple sugar transport system substrate-binding protein